MHRQATTEELEVDEVTVEDTIPELVEEKVEEVEPLEEEVYLTEESKVTDEKTEA